MAGLLGSSAEENPARLPLRRRAVGACRRGLQSRDAAASTQEEEGRTREEGARTREARRARGSRDAEWSSRELVLPNPLEADFRRLFASLPMPSSIPNLLEMLLGDHARGWSIYNA